MNNCVSAFYFTFKPELDRMLKSLYHFHPEINVSIMTREDISKLDGYIGGYYYATIGKNLAKKYDGVTHIDADVIVVDKIDCLFATDVDVLAGRNNSDNNMAGKDRGFTLPGLDPMKYVNAGIHTVNNINFWEDWYSACIDHGYKVQHGEQGILNELFHSGKYTSRIIDPVDSDIYLGTSFQYGTVTMWDSWKNIIVKDNGLYLNNKRIKMLHIAGGGLKPPLKDLLTKEVCDFIETIIND